MDTTGIDLLNLIQQDTILKKRAGTNGGEWAGPCPFCGGRDRFRVWPTPKSGNPRCWCRQCGFGGDAIRYVMRRDQVDFRHACERLALEPGRVQFCVRSRPDDWADRRSFVSHERAWSALTDEGWQHQAEQFWTRCWDAFWLESQGQVSPGREYLLMRGFRDNVLACFALGYNPRPYRATWGGVTVWLPVGIVIPNEIDDTIWALNVRRMDGRTPKYIKAKGSANGLFFAGAILPQTTVVMVEGELDAISIWQETHGQDVTAVATGSTNGGYLHEWIARLSEARRVVLAFDADEPGEQAARRWQRAFPGAVRLRPTRHDVNDMLRAGDDIPAWLRGAGVV